MRWLFLLLLCPALSEQVSVPMDRMVIRVVEAPLNQPVEGARVEISESRPGRIPPRRRTAYCGSGSCDFPLLPGFSYFVTVQHPLYLLEENPFLERAEFEFIAQKGASPEFEVRMIRPALMEGKVYDHHGKPVPGANLTLRSSFQIDGEFRPFRMNGRSTADGSFRFGRIPPGKFSMWIRPPASVLERTYTENKETGEATGYAVQIYHTGVEEESYAEPVLTWPGAQLSNRAVVLRPMRVFHLTGRLIDHHSQEPLRNAQVALRTATRPQQEIYNPVLVDFRDASFEFDDLAAGEYELLVYRPGANNSLPWVVPMHIDKTSGAPDLAISVPAWSRVPVDLRIQREVPSSAGIRVGLRSEDNPEDLVLAQFQSGDNFGFPGLPPGRYVPIVIPPRQAWVSEVRYGRGDAFEHGVNLVEGSEMPLEVTLRAGPAGLKGEVFDDRDRPVKRGQVLIIPEDTALRRRPNAVISARILPNGSFEVTGLVPGIYRVIALHGPAPQIEGIDQLVTRYAVDWMKVETVSGFVTPLTLRAIAP